MKRYLFNVAISLLMSVALWSCCASKPSRFESSHDEAIDTSSWHVIDLTQTVTSSRYEEPSCPANPATQTFVPWDDRAFLEVHNEDDPHTGSLIVRYGKSWWEDKGEAWRMYVLEAAGSVIEPISLRWQPNSGSSFRAIALVDGELRYYDFDR